MGTMNYKGYTGSVDYSEEDNWFVVLIQYCKFIGTAFPNRLIINEHYTE